MMSRRGLLFVAFLVVLGMAIWVGGDEVSAPRNRPMGTQRGSISTNADVLALDLSLPRRMSSSDEIRDPFKRSIPPPLARPDAVAPPEGPSQPFVLIGRYVEAGGKPLIFLAEDEQLHAVRPGEVIDGKYRVDAKNDEIRITHLPSRQTMVLQIGERQ